MPIQLRRGASGPTVRLLQRRLHAHGHQVTVDGDFGPRTEAAVRQFQAAAGVPVDGVVGPITWRLLLSQQVAGPDLDEVEEHRAWLRQQIPTGLRGEVAAVLDAAIGQLGQAEVPPGSNGGPEIAHIVGDLGPDAFPRSAYWRHWQVNSSRMPPWCAIFVSWALREGLEAPDWNSTPFGNWFGAVSQIETWARAEGRWATSGSAARPGKVFTMARASSGSDPGATSAGHCGFVVARLPEGRVLTIEGNVSNAVGSHRRKIAQLEGFVRWW